MTKEDVVTSFNGTYNDKRQIKRQEIVIRQRFILFCLEHEYRNNSWFDARLILIEYCF